MDAADVTARLAPISLDELVAGADMLTRIDRKYLLDASDLPGVIGALDHATRVLEVDGTRVQSYRSTYLDTPDLECYRAAARPRRRRFKVRTRTYVDSGTAFLEIKTRGPRGVTVKNRTPIPTADANAGRLTPSGRAWVAGQLAGAGRDRRPAETLEPVLRCSYRRITLAPVDGGRATVDADVEWTAPTERDRFSADLAGPGSAGACVSAPGLVIVETKSGSRPSHLDRALWSLGHRPARLSKYGTGLAALDPALPANRWTRVLRRVRTSAKDRP